VRVVHEHPVPVTELASFLDAHGPWYVNGPISTSGRCVWGYAEAATDDKDTPVVWVTLTDPMAVEAFRVSNPITGATQSLLLSRSFADDKECPVCTGTPDAG